MTAAREQELRDWIQRGGYGCKSRLPCNCWQHTTEDLLAEIDRLRKEIRRDWQVGEFDEDAQKEKPE